MKLLLYWRAKMSKELEAFNCICCNTNQNYPAFQKQRKIVETALKNAEDRHKRAKWANNKIEQDLVSNIEEKIENAQNDLIGNHDLDKRERLKGEIEAYYDVVCLIKFKYGVE